MMIKGLVCLAHSVTAVKMMAAPPPPLHELSSGCDTTEHIYQFSAFTPWDIEGNKLTMDDIFQSTWLCPALIKTQKRERILDKASLRMQGYMEEAEIVADFLPQHLSSEGDHPRHESLVLRVKGEQLDEFYASLDGIIRRQAPLSGIFDKFWGDAGEYQFEVLVIRYRAVFEAWMMKRKEGSDEWVNCHDPVLLKRDFDQYHWSTSHILQGDFAYAGKYIDLMNQAMPHPSRVDEEVDAERRATEEDTTIQEAIWNSI